MKLLISTIANLIIEFIRNWIAEYKMKMLNKKISIQEIKTNEAVKQAEEATDNFLASYAEYDATKDASLTVRRDTIQVQNDSGLTKNSNRGTKKRTRIEKYKNKRTRKSNKATKRKQSKL